MILSFAGPGSSPDADFPIFLSVNDSINVDTFIFSGHTNNLASGNWVELSGDGNQYAIPSLSTSISLPLTTKYTVGSSEVNISSYSTSYSVDYPINVNSFFTTGDSINAKFWGSSNLQADSGLVWRLIKTTQDNLVTTWEDLLNSDPSTFKTLVSSGGSAWESGSITLDGNGDSETSLTAPSAGSYILVLVRESSSPYELVIYGITFFEILDYDITSSNPSSVYVGDYVDVSINLVGASTSTGFIYSAALVHKDAFDFNVAMVMNSATDISINVNNEPVIDSSGTAGNLTLLFPGLTSITSLDKAELAGKANSIFGSNNFAVGFSDTITQSSTIVSVSTNGLNTGDYKVLIGVYEVDSPRELIAFKETSLTVNPTQNGGGGGGPAGGGVFVPGLVKPPLPEVWAIELFSPKEAYDVCSQYSAEEVAELLAQVSENKVFKILSLYNTSDAWTIYKLLPQNMTVSIILSMAEGSDRDTVIEFMTMMTEDDSIILESMLGEDFNSSILIIDESVKLLIENRDLTETPEVLSQLGDLLMQLDEDVLVEICIGIAGLPSTPEITGVILLSLDDTVRQGIISEWLASGPVDLLIKVFESWDPVFVGEIYRSMTSSERLIVYPQLSSTIVSELPEIGEFVYSNLVINPPSGEVGQEFTISVTISNQGETDDFLAELWINGILEGSVKDILEMTKNQILSFSVTRFSVGDYTVNIGGETGSFEILLPEPEIQPAAFSVPALVLLPNYVNVDDPFDVLVTIENTGGESGVYEAILKIDGEEIDRKQVPLDSGETLSILFNVERGLDYGTYEISVGEKSASLNVIETPSPFPWTMTLIFVLITGIAITYWMRDNIRGWMNPVLKN